VSDLPALQDCGFVRVPQPGGPPLWMTCNGCGKSDHFFVADDRVRCRCGASYDHAVRPDGSTAPFAVLTFVPFADGPKHLADLEWDPTRVGALAAGLAALIAAAAAGWWFLG
jgi:hypothetical protein